MLLTFQGHTQCLDNAGGLRMRIHQPKTTTPEAEEWITFRAGVAAGSDLFLVFFNGQLPWGGVMSLKNRE
jgi:hypothetical protein